MKTNNATVLFLAGLLIFGSCADQNKKIVFYPEPEQEAEDTEFESRQIIESQNGPAGVPLPEWVSSFFEGGMQKTETLSSYQDRYVFIGENQGTNFGVLYQWADRFSTTQDMPRLVALRVEKKLLAAAKLYPDDEYGEYYEALMKSVSNAKYSGAVKEGIFWIKRLVRIGEIASDDAASDDIAPNDTMVSDNTEAAQMEVFEERYEFFVLVSIEKTVFQAKIRELMGGIKTTVPPNRNQAASINRVQQSFFERF